MKKINDLILKLTYLQNYILQNVDAYDDDLEETWERMKLQYVEVKEAMDKYIKQGEQ